MKSLVITIKWNESFGFDNSDLLYTNYMKTKDFVILEKDNEFCSTQELIEMLKDMQLNPQNYSDVDFQPRIVVNRTYFFKDRMFCTNNKSFEKFISKVKRYYQNKLKFYKNPRMLMNRSLTGKFPNFINKINN